MTASIILFNGRIHTVDSDDTIVEAIAIKGNKILAVGGNEEIKKYGNRDTMSVDLHGKTVLPGIFDSHNHTGAAGVLLKGVMLFGAKNIKELQNRVAQRVAESQVGSWIRGGGWIESQFTEYRLPTRWDLDEVAPDNPVILSRLFGAVVVNSSALKLAGITKHTVDPWRGSIGRAKNGEPNGILYDGARELVTRVMPAEAASNTVEEAKKDILRALTEYQKYGITSIIDPGVSGMRRLAYQLLFNENNLPIRINMMPVYNGLYASMGQDLTPMVEHMGIINGFGNEWLNLGALKMAIDGGLGSKTSWMNESFLDGTFSEIPLRLDINKLGHYFATAQKYRWSIGIHCCGDKAQDVAVDTFVKTIINNPNSDARHNIIHGYFPTPKSLDNMQKYNIGVSVQPGFMYVEGDIYFDVIEQERVNRFKPLKTYLDAGILVAANSDMTSAHYNPFLGMYAAVARKTSQGRSLGTEEKINRREMLRLFTINGAKLAFMADKTGSLEQGKLADLVVINEDILTVAEDEIKDLKVLLNITDGRIVYDSLHPTE